MVFKRLFYTVKPMIPRRVQILLRRRLAVHKREKHSHIWPIDITSAQPPKGWSGWPEGKQFALVLSHDVDTIRGYNNVLKVAELEERMVFRSCFSFVPERYGRVSLDLLDQLRTRGFDVAVHGLKHDGKLFLSKRTFDRQALRINGYLKKWRTEGFTSPSMQRNLEWMTALNIDYSTSTFDTDPFEPQPDGAGTIFPFVVYRTSSQLTAHSSQPNSCCNEPLPMSSDLPSSYELSAMSNELSPMSSDLPCSHEPSAMSCEPSSCFIELPYTVPQDSTLFVILLEKTINIWKRKLDWVAEKGGMALLNTHPDYMNGSSRWGREEYPMRFYEEFLSYVKEKYEGRYWHALPREVARFWKEKMVTKINP
jgi:hypothetical protein